MDKLLVVTWEVDRLILREISPRGIWTDERPISATVDLARPTRFSVLSTPEYMDKLRNGLAKLFQKFVVSPTEQSEYSVWVMLPKRWVQYFRIDNPNLHSDELQESNLIWETELRLHEKITDYRLLLPGDYSTKFLEISVVNKNILQIILDTVRQADIQLAGVCVEPAENEPYKIDRAENFIRATTVESHPVTESIFNDRKVWLMASAIFVVVVGIQLFLIFRGATTSVPTQQDPTVSEVVEDVVEQVIESPDVDETISPLRMIVQTLSDGTRIEFATLSPADFKAEISGLDDPETWLTGLHQQPIFQSLRLEGGYPRNGVNTILVRMEPSGWMTDDNSDGLARWEHRAVSAGLTAEGHIARGSFDSVLSLVDSLWIDPDGVVKIIIAPLKTGDVDGDQWTIRVQ